MLSVLRWLNGSSFYPHTPHRKQVVDGNRKLLAHRINGYIPGRIMLLLANIHTKPRPIWFSRHGESQFNAQGRIGGDSPLSPRGMLYAQKLHEFVSGVYPRSRYVWMGSGDLTSTGTSPGGC